MIFREYIRSSQKILPEMARSNPDKNPKMSTIDVMNYYLKKGSEEGIIYYISFRGKSQKDINPKLGDIEHHMFKNINAEYKSTPAAIYGYPLIPSLFINRTGTGFFEHYMSSIDESSQYQIFKIKDGYNGIIIEKSGHTQFNNKESESEIMKNLKDQIDILLNYTKENEVKNNRLSQKLHNYYEQPDYFEYGYSLLKTLLFVKKEHENTIISNEPEDSDFHSFSIARQFSNVLRKIGIDYITDKGSSTIHSNEPEQIIVLNSSAIQGVYADTNRNQPSNTIEAINLTGEAFWQKMDSNMDHYEITNIPSNKIIKELKNVDFDEIDPMVFAKAIRRLRTKLVGYGHEKTINEIDNVYKRNPNPPRQGIIGSVNYLDAVVNAYSVLETATTVNPYYMETYINKMFPSIIKQVYKEYIGSIMVSNSTLNTLSNDMVRHGVFVDKAIRWSDLLPDEEYFAQMLNSHKSEVMEYQNKVKEARKEGSLYPVNTVMIKDENINK